MKLIRCSSCRLNEWKLKPSTVWHDLKARLFILLSRNALRTSERLHVPQDRLIEIGVHMEI